MQIERITIFHLEKDVNVRVDKEQGIIVVDGNIEMPLTAKELLELFNSEEFIQELIDAR